MEGLGRGLVAGLHVGMDFLGLGPPRLAHRVEIGVRFEPQQLERAHFVVAARAVAAAHPAVVRRFAEARVVAPLGLFARLGFLLLQPFEIVPSPVVFAGVLLAEIPSVGAVRRLGRGMVARLVATVAVAHAHLRGLARAAVAAPAGKSPIRRSSRAGHAVTVHILPSYEADKARQPAKTSDRDKILQLLHCNIASAPPYARAMSKQLSLSAAFSVFALAALALSQGGAVAARLAPMQTGATTEAAAPALLFGNR
jgi:hypothetical protein